MTMTLNPQTQAQWDALMALVQSLDIPICDQPDISMMHRKRAVCSPNEITEEEFDKIIKGSKIVKSHKIEEWL